MAIDQSLKVQNGPGGSMTIQGSVVGPQGNHASIGGAPSTRAGGVDAGQLFPLLTSLRVAAATTAGLAPHVRARLIGCAAEAQRCVAAGDDEGSAQVLLHARMALEPAATDSAGGATLRELLEAALDLASSRPG